MRKISLGLIETWGTVPAIEAADAGAKAADVSLLGLEVTPTALVTVKFVGDVGAVKAAVAAAKAAAGRVGKVVATHVIPRPDLQLGITPPERPPEAVAKGAPVPPAPPAGRKTPARAKPKKSRPKKKAGEPIRGKSALLKKSTQSGDAAGSVPKGKSKKAVKDAAESGRKAPRGRKPKTDKKSKPTRS